MDLIQGRSSRPARRVIFSDRAHAAIVAETFAQHPNETGGILLGHYLDGAWHVIEAIDPGPCSRFSPVSFEYDTAYVNHLARKVAGHYERPLRLIGLWHRHPGSNDRFSHDDDITNRRYAIQSTEGTISCLVNLDPHFRITAYHVPRDLNYRRLPHHCGDGAIPTELRELRRSSCLHPDALAAREEQRSLQRLLSTSPQTPQAGPVSPGLMNLMDSLMELLEQQQRFAYGLQLRGTCINLALVSRTSAGQQLLQIQEDGSGQLDALRRLLREDSHV
ncbi:MAG: Mov34/MPN/PAD-1 family protein [Cyanobacteriota bacterium]|nr:Mov34/MPN/PAD-1 family protein [Cyanobacteriota bacterium]